MIEFTPPIAPALAAARPNVPALVIGLAGLAVSPVPAVILVTVPLPPGVAHVPSPRRYVDELGVPVTGLAAGAVTLPSKVPLVGPAMPANNSVPVEPFQFGKYPLVLLPGPLTFPPPLPPPAKLGTEQTKFRICCGRMLAGLALSLK